MFLFNEWQLLPFYIIVLFVGNSIFEGVFRLELSEQLYVVLRIFF